MKEQLIKFDICDGPYNEGTYEEFRMDGVFVTSDKYEELYELAEEMLINMPDSVIEGFGFDRKLDKFIHKQCKC